MGERTDLFYTFGNHHHWVDMEWLWGYDVMSGDVEDMLAFCRGTGAKGNVNWEAGGFEKIAAEQPEAFALLRQAIRDRTVEVIGGSYGQPYGLFQGDESNIRQMIYGVRTNLRLFGVRPRSFWEEEFYFFPQLPQILTGVGYRYASLFFQWTWHTPEVPVEESPAVWWEGQDDSRLKTVSRNRMNVHQWPEDIDAVLTDISQNPAPDGQSHTPVLLQWLELMPTKDWMCRSEVLLPKTRELLADPRFRFHFGTLSDYLAGLSDELPVRRYAMDDVWHGMSLGKNGDLFRQISRETETTLLAAESLSALGGLLGRPYAQWDVYPTWELEEAWRELLMAQHHDNDECEGLCGHVGKFSYERSQSLSGHVLDAAMANLAKRVDAAEGSLVVYNPLPWERDAWVRHPQSGARIRAIGLPPMGYRAVDAVAGKIDSAWEITPTGAVGRFDGMAVEVGNDGAIARIGELAGPSLAMSVTEDGRTVTFEVESMGVNDDGDLAVGFRHPVRGGVQTVLGLHGEGLDIKLTAEGMPKPDQGMHRGLVMAVLPNLPTHRLIADQPLGQQEVFAESDFRKKYPTGDWMTSPQWFEDIRRPFTASSLVDFAGDGQGLLVLADRTRQWFRLDGGAQCLLTMADPWDEEYFVDRFEASFRLIPHAGLTNAQRYRLAREFDRPVVAAIAVGNRPSAPALLAGPTTDCENVVVLSFYREMESAGRELETYGGSGMGYPTVLRLLELDGVETEATVRLPGTAASAVRTNLLGEPEGEASLDGDSVKLTLKPFSLATVYVDLVDGRKQVRDLDAHREVWAQVHRE